MRLFRINGKLCITHEGSVWVEAEEVTAPAEPIGAELKPAKRKQGKGTKGGKRSKLTDEQRDAIRTCLADGEKAKNLALKYGVSMFTIYQINQRKKVGERNYWVDLIAKLVDRRIPHLMALLEGWPLELIKQSYLETKSESNPVEAWWVFRKKVLDRPLRQKPLLVDK
jgi:hypothetical protein